MPIRELFEKADFFPEPLAVISASGSIDAANVSFARQFGSTPTALSGMRLDTLSAGTAAAIEGYLHACADSGRVVEGSLSAFDGSRKKKNIYFFIFFYEICRRAQ